MIRKAATDARKKDTREKIELGGLIVKAGLRFEKRALLLGALIEVRERLKSDDSERARLTAIGLEAFGHERE
ncbi:type IV conjugative transfer system coupling protein TraD (plasmid) [Agrobacterium tumefaciens]|nr:type IV conjugative transfer system coupling protein TraD [Agrobacterium tumefaciens]